MGQIVPPAEIVKELALPVDAHGVDGEIPPRRVGREIIGETHRRMAAVAGDVFAQGGDFKGLTAADRRDRAMGEARRDHLDAGRL